MTVNGEEVTREVEPRLLLVHFLRDHLGLTGTHWGCDTSNCGVCVVWMDGEPVKSCTVLAAMADGREVRTVEDMERDGELDPVQQGFMQEHGLQCGFCTPGMMMTRPLAARPQPRPATSRDPGGDLRHRSAAAPATRTSCGPSAGPPSTRPPEVTARTVAEPRAGPTGDHRRRARRADQRRRQPDRLRPHAAQGGRPLPPRQGQLRRRHRSCRACSTAPSCAAPTPTPASSPSTRPPPRPTPRSRPSSPARRWRPWAWRGCRPLSHDVQAVLATDKVRFQGQEVAFVVAEDRYSARDALELIDVEYEPLPPVIDARTALDPGAPVIRDDIEGKTDNHIFDWESGDQAACDAVFAGADVVVAQDMLYPRVHPAPMETCGSIADMDKVTGKLTIWTAPPRRRTPTAPSTPWWPACPSTRSRSSRPTSAAASATRSASTPATCCVVVARSSPASR